MRKLSNKQKAIIKRECRKNKNIMRFIDLPLAVMEELERDNDMEILPALCTDYIRRIQ